MGEGLRLSGRGPDLRRMGQAMKSSDARRIMESGLAGSELAVLLGLWSFADREGKCWPSMARVAHRAGLSLRAAQGAVGRVVSLGLVGCLRRPGRTPVYQLDLEAIAAYDPSSICGGAASAGVQELRGRGAASAGEVVIEGINKKESTKKAPPKEKVNPSTAGGWDEFNAIRMRNCPGVSELSYATWSTEWRRAVQKAGSVERLLLAWRCFWESPALLWWRTTPRHPHATFFRGKHLPLFLQASDDWTAGTGAADAVSTVTGLEDTSSRALASVWLASNGWVYTLDPDDVLPRLQRAVSDPEIVKDVMESEQEGRPAQTLELVH